MDESLKDDVIYRREILKRLDKIAEEIKEVGKNISDKLDDIKSRIRVIGPIK